MIDPVNVACGYCNVTYDKQRGHNCPGTIDYTRRAVGELAVMVVDLAKRIDALEKRMPSADAVCPGDRAKEHEPGCPRLQFWDAGEDEARCTCKPADDEGEK